MERRNPNFRKENGCLCHGSRRGPRLWEDTCGDDVDALLLPRDHRLRSARGLTGQHNGIVHDDIQRPWLGLDNGRLCGMKEKGKAECSRLGKYRGALKLYNLSRLK